MSVMVTGVVVDAKTKKAKPKAEALTEIGTEDSALTENKETYSYSPAGKTDPFESFLKKSSGVKGTNLAAARDKALDDAEEIFSRGEPETELERIDISKLTLTSIIKGPDNLWAMVVDPKGRGYFLKKGTKIGTKSGFVGEIVSEQKQTDFGIEAVRKVIIKIPYRDRDRNIIYRSIALEMPHASM